MRKKNGAGGINFPSSDYTTNYNNQNSMVLAPKQKYRPVEQDRKPRNKPMHLCEPGTLFLTKEARIYNGAKTASSINGAGKTRKLHVKEWNENTSKYHTQR